MSQRGAMRSPVEWENDRIGPQNNTEYSEGNFDNILNMILLAVLFKMNILRVYNQIIFWIYNFAYSDHQQESVIFDLSLSLTDITLRCRPLLKL